MASSLRIIATLARLNACTSLCVGSSSVSSSAFSVFASILPRRPQYGGPTNLRATAATSSTSPTDSFAGAAPLGAESSRKRRAAARASTHILFASGTLTAASLRRASASEQRRLILRGHEHRHFFLGSDIASTVLLQVTFHGVAEQFRYAPKRGERRCRRRLKEKRERLLLLRVVHVENVGLDVNVHIVLKHADVDGHLPVGANDAHETPRRQVALVEREHARQKLLLKCHVLPHRHEAEAFVAELNAPGEGGGRPILRGRNGALLRSGGAGGTLNLVLLDSRLLIGLRQNRLAVEHAEGRLHVGLRIDPHHAARLEQQLVVGDGVAVGDVLLPDAEHHLVHAEVLDAVQLLVQWAGVADDRVAIDEAGNWYRLHAENLRLHVGRRVRAVAYDCLLVGDDGAAPVRAVLRFVWHAPGARQQHHLRAVIRLVGGNLAEAFGAGNLLLAVLRGAARMRRVAVHRVFRQVARRHHRQLIEIAVEAETLIQVLQLLKRRLDLLDEPLIVARRIGPYTEVADEVEARVVIGDERHQLRRHAEHVARQRIDDRLIDRALHRLALPPQLEPRVPHNAAVLCAHERRLKQAHALGAAQEQRLHHTLVVGAWQSGVPRHREVRAVYIEPLGAREHAKKNARKYRLDAVEHLRDKCIAAPPVRRVAEFDEMRAIQFPVLDPLRLVGVAHLLRIGLARLPHLDDFVIGEANAARARHDVQRGIYSSGHQGTSL